MQKNKLLLALSLPSIIITLASCSKAEEDRWSYTREDMATFVKAEGALYTEENGNYKMSVVSGIPLLGRALEKNDVIVYDIAASEKRMAEEKKSYADYEVLSSSKVTLSDVSSKDDLSSFTVSFAPKKESGVKYGVLINKNAVYNSSFMMVEQEKNHRPIVIDDPQEQFEEDYVNTNCDTSSGWDFAYSLISNIGTIVAGALTDNYVSIWTGAMGILGTLTNSFSSSASIQDVLNMLKETDAKINELSDKIDRNTQQLADEIVRTEAAVDQATLTALGLAITDFANNSVSVIDTYNRGYSDVLSTKFKEFVKSAQTVKLGVKKGEDGKYSSIPLGNLKEADINLSIDINDFPKAKAFLEEHNNIVEKGFMDEFNADIEEAVKASTLPEGLDVDRCSLFVEGMINQIFTKGYYSENKAKAQEIRDVMINYCQRMTGDNGAISMLSTYMQRLRYMYNFGYEVKKPITSICANLMYRLDMNVARAAEALMYAELTGEELQENFTKAREEIKKLHDQAKEIEDMYSFTTSSKLKGRFYSFAYNPYYTIKGNECKLHVDSALEYVSMEPGGEGLVFTPTSFSERNPISSIENTRIATRYNLMKAFDESAMEKDYISYLAANQAVDWQASFTYEMMKNWRVIGPEACRILTNDYEEVSLGSSNTERFTCVDNGNEHADFFEIGKQYTYGDRGSQFWSGKLFKGNFVDGITGSNIGTSVISGWARYAESHWYWSQDEYWAFRYNGNTNYFFMIDKIA
ncbi:MAG: hypothetical protein MJ239_03110 [Bacilli bacterium]|nr:hypothetical protein [Bacilli bacterium]